MTSLPLDNSSSMADRYHSAFPTLVTLSLLLLLYACHRNLSAAPFLPKLIARVTIRAAAPVSLPRAVPLDLEAYEATTVDQWVKRILALAPTVSYVHDLPQAVSNPASICTSCPFSQRRTGRPSSACSNYHTLFTSMLFP